MCNWKIVTIPTVAMFKKIKNPPDWRVLKGIGNLLKAEIAETVFELGNTTTAVNESL